MTHDPSLCLVIGRANTCGRDLIALTLEAVAGGVTMVQLREKGAGFGEFLELARALKTALAPVGVPLFINDAVEVARACGAEGVHLGQTDMPVAEARALLGPGVAIGLSVETREQVVAAEALEVDYLGVSPVFATGSKGNVGEPWGLDGLRWIKRHSRHPLVAIGGVTPANASNVFKAGANGIAVISAICAAADPRAAARALLVE